MSKTTIDNTEQAAGELAPPAAGESPKIDPKELILGENVRTKEYLPGFLDSLRAEGVRTAINVYRDDAGGLVVLEGFHRTWGALDVGLAAVPYYVVPRPASKAERIVGQMIENDQRRSTTTAERLAAYEELTLEGFSDRDIAKRLSRDRKEVKAALTIARTTHARAAVETRGLALTLPQAIVMAEYDGDEDALAQLVAAAEKGTFDHVAQQIHDARVREAARQAVLDRLTADGIKVTRMPNWNDTKLARLTDLHDLEGTALKARTHAACPGHAAFLVEVHAAKDPDKMFRFDYACTDYKTYRHYQREEKLRPADMTEVQRQESKAARADVISSNRAWASAQTVRRDWLTGFAKRKKAPAASVPFIAVSYALADHQLKQALTKGNRLGLDLLGVEQKAGYGNPRSLLLAETVSQSTDSRAQMIMLVLVLAAYEDALPANAWRGANTSAARYLTFLAEQGYVLSEVENRACAAVAEPGEEGAAAEPATEPEDEASEDGDESEGER